MNQEENNQPHKVRQLETSERYLAFSLKSEQYAIPLLEVKEVIGMTEATPIPGTPSYFRGIINLRGQVISVIDLRAKLQLVKPENGPETSIIILDLDQLCLGVIVDSINSVLALGPEDLSPAPDGTDLKEQYLTGVARRDNRLTLLLDVRATLNIQDLAALKSVAAPKSAA
jgi:purine-binding chemotaxis protein CheW